MKHELIIKEYEMLRREIDLRTQLSAGLVVAAIAAFGASATVAANFPDVSIGLSTILSFLWLTWIDYTRAIFKIAAYLALCSAPKLNGSGVSLPLGHVGNTILSWEFFDREIRSVNDIQVKLMLNFPARRYNFDWKYQLSRYYVLLFGVAALIAPVFYLLYLFIQNQANVCLEPFCIVRFICIIASISLSIITWCQYRKSHRFRYYIGEAIRTYPLQFR